MEIYDMFFSDVLLIQCDDPIETTESIRQMLEQYGHVSSAQEDIKSDGPSLEIEARFFLELWHGAGESSDEKIIMRFGVDSTRSNIRQTSELRLKIDAAFIKKPLEMRARDGGFFTSALREVKHESEQEAEMPSIKECEHLARHITDTIRDAYRAATLM